MQLYSTERKASQTIEGYAACFIQIKTDSSQTPVSFFCFATQCTQQLAKVRSYLFFSNCQILASYCPSITWINPPFRQENCRSALYHRWGRRLPHKYFGYSFKTVMKNYDPCILEIRQIRACLYDNKTRISRTLQNGISRMESLIMNLSNFAEWYSWM